MSLLKRTGFSASFLLTFFLVNAAGQQGGREGKADVTKGKEVFFIHCSYCHNADSDVAEGGRPGLKGLFKWPRHRLADGTEHREHTVEMIRRLLVEGTSEMRPRGIVLSDREMDDLLAYLQTL